jgi:hypothetical protein
MANTLPGRNPEDNSSSEQHAATPDAVRVFVSYSHDSLEHEQRVLRLARRLRAEGIDAHIDAFEQAPPEGWPAWMMRQMSESRYVLVVCTAKYLRRVSGEEQTGVGLGARWEGVVITQELYDQGGRNDKFIPVVFDVDDVKTIPIFLRQTTRYNLSEEDDYERLYRRLTSQPAVPKPSLGTPRVLPPNDTRQPPEAVSTRPLSLPQPSQNDERGESTTSVDLVAIMNSATDVRLVPLLRLSAGQETEAELQPDLPADRAYFETLVGNPFPSVSVGLAFGLTAILARIKNVKHTRREGRDLFSVTFIPDEGRRRSGSYDMGTSSLSADEIAELRARRILLDELPPTAHSKWHRSSEQSTVEMFVRGLGSELAVERSPLPDLFRRTRGGDRRRFLIAAKLLAVLWLKLTGTVEHVLELDISFASDSSLNIHFRGERARLYTNREPISFMVEGTCHLGPT